DAVLLFPGYRRDGGRECFSRRGVLRPGYRHLHHLGSLVMTAKISVNSQAKLTEAITSLTTMYRDKRFVVVSLRPGKDRTLDQNALWFAFYKRIAEMTQIGDASEARKHCKLHHGVQILINEDEDYRAAWHRTT